MRFVFATLVLLHGLIHILGVLKGFRITELKQLAEPISVGMAWIWGLAAMRSLQRCSSVKTAFCATLLRTTDRAR
jgi:hypothetical protein